MASTLTVKHLPSRDPNPSKGTPAHHVAPSTFTNPWPSFQKLGSTSEFYTRFISKERNFVPVPEGPNGTRSKELVKVLKPDWGAKKPGLKTTWIGHASFLIELPTLLGEDRGVRVLLDPMWSERTSPVGFIGPKRYTPVPCSLEEVPDVDIVCISHNHYDHLDYATIMSLYQRRKGNVHFFVPLKNKAWFVQHIGCDDDEVSELDWWESREINVPGVGNLRLTCTPAQHSSGRSLLDKGHTLWCSWALESLSRSNEVEKKLYFAGDTAYAHPNASAPCPIYKEIGTLLGPFDLALLPIGLMTPASVMGSVHATPEQSLEIHKEIRAKRSIGMHYGTVRGGISGQYEDVRDPPRRWKAVAVKEGCWLGGGVEGDGTGIKTDAKGVGLMHVGETVAV